MTGLYSSSAVDSECDRIQSPEIRLSASSTLSLYNQFATEPTSTDSYDRANVGLFDLATGGRSTIVPNAGRLYTLNPGTPNGTCVTQGQAGWNGAGPGTPRLRARNEVRRHPRLFVVRFAAKHKLLS